VLDPRARRVLLDYQAGKCDLEAAAQVLLQVRRDTGCLEIHAPPGTAPPQQLLVARFAELVQAEFGT
jgi:hypothetical protein